MHRPSQCRGAQRAAARGSMGPLRPLEVRDKEPEVGKQVVGQRHRLAALSVGVAWQPGLGLLGGAIEQVARQGIYVSIWRRQADGSWKVEMDLGNPTG